MAEEKPSGNKVIVAVGIFFVLGFFINLFLNYNQTTVNQEKAATTDEILLQSQKNSQILEENKRKLDELSNRIKVLEDNSKKP